MTPNQEQPMTLVLYHPGLDALILLDGAKEPSVRIMFILDGWITIGEL